MNKKLIFLIIIIFASIFSIYLFWNRINIKQKQSAETKEPEDFQNVVVAESDMANSASAFIIHIIQTKGLDEKNGVKIKAVNLPPVEAYQALLNGTAEVAPFSPISSVKANTESGREIKLFGKAFIFDAYLTVAINSNIKDLEELRSKKIGSVQKNSEVYPLMDAVFQELGYDTEKDFTIVTAPFAALPILLEKGEVDAIVVIEPSYSRLIATGKVKTILSFTDLLPTDKGIGKPFAGLAANQDWLINHQKEAIGLRNAWYEAANYITANPNVFGDQDIRDFIQPTNNEEMQLLKNAYSRILPTSWNDSDIQSATAFLSFVGKWEPFPENASFDIFTLANNPDN